MLHNMGFPGVSEDKESSYIAGDLGSIPGWGKIPWRRARQPTPVFLPGQSHGQGAWRATVHRVSESWIQLSD